MSLNKPNIVGLSRPAPDNNTDESEFSDVAKDLLESARQMVAYENGILSEKDGIIVKEYQVPDEVDVKAIRNKLGFTQKEFSIFGFSTSAVRHWEQGLRTPEGSARVLLKVIEKHPDIVLESIHNQQPEL